MQNLSILQLLKTLSAVSTPSSSTPDSNGAPVPSAPRSDTEGKNSQAEPFVPPTHARKEEEKAVYAYENFLSRHERVVQRVKNKTDKK